MWNGIRSMGEDREARGTDNVQTCIGVRPGGYVLFIITATGLDKSLLFLKLVPIVASCFHHCSFSNSVPPRHGLGQALTPLTSFAEFSGSLKSGAFHFV